MTSLHANDNGAMLIFDFDGVLLNSVVEMSITAYNAVTGGLATSPDDLPGNAATLFMTNRYHVQPAGDAINLMAWCVEHDGLPGDHRLEPAEYRAIRESSDIPLKERTVQFFAARKRFVAHDPVQWPSLNTVYQPVWDELKGQDAEGIVILTNKNREATVTLCHHFGLAVRPENVYAGDHGATKIENLEAIQARFGRERYGFVDDSIGNLEELDAHFNAEVSGNAGEPGNADAPSLELMLASWGYIGPDDHALARHAGYAILDQAGLIARIASMKGVELGSP